MITVSFPFLLKPTLPIYKHLLTSHLKNKNYFPTATTPFFIFTAKLFHTDLIFCLKLLPILSYPVSLIHFYLVNPRTNLLLNSVLNLLSSNLWCLFATLSPLRAFLSLALRIPQGSLFLLTPWLFVLLAPWLLIFCSVFGPLHFQPQSSQPKASPYILMTPNFYPQPDFS